MSELEAMDVELAKVGQELWERLTRAEDEADTNAYDAALAGLGRVGRLGGRIARELQLAGGGGQPQAPGIAKAGGDRGSGDA